VAVDRYAAELINELRAVATSLFAASAKASDSPELSAYLSAWAERLQRALERYDGTRANNDTRAAAGKTVIPFVPQRFHSGRATQGRCRSRRSPRETLRARPWRVDTARRPRTG